MSKATIKAALPALIAVLLCLRVPRGQTRSVLAGRMLRKICVSTQRMQQQSGRPLHETAHTLSDTLDAAKQRCRHGAFRGPVSPARATPTQMRLLPGTAWTRARPLLEHEHDCVHVVVQACCGAGV